MLLSMSYDCWTGTSCFETPVSVNDMVTPFYDTVFRSIGRHTPLRRIHPRRLDKHPWWNADLRHRRNVLRKARRRFQRYRTDENRCVLRRLESEYDDCIMYIGFFPWVYFSYPRLSQNRSILLLASLQRQKKMRNLFLQKCHLETKRVTMSVVPTCWTLLTHQRDLALINFFPYLFTDVLRC